MTVNSTAVLQTFETRNGILPKFPNISHHFHDLAHPAWRTYVPGQVPTIPPEYAKVIATFGPMRQTDFLYGRAAAREAIHTLGRSDTFVGTHSDGTPVWPQGIVGSISHSTGVCMAVVAQASDYNAIGVDIERIDRVETDLWPHICTEEERLWLEQMLPAEAQINASIIFCAKEAFFKMQWPITQEWLDFDDVVVTLRDGHFLVTVPKPLPPLTSATFVGTYAVWNAYVVATVADMRISRSNVVPYGSCVQSQKIATNDTPLDQTGQETGVI